MLTSARPAVSYGAPSRSTSTALLPSFPSTKHIPRASISLSQSHSRTSMPPASITPFHLDSSPFSIREHFHSALSSLRAFLLSSLHDLYLLLTFQLIVHPDSTAKCLWDWFLLSSILYNTLALPFVIAFTPTLATSSLLLVLDILTTLLMTADMFLICRTAVPDHTHTLVYDTRTIVRRYAHSLSLKLDAFSTFPFFLFSFLIHTSSFQVFTINTLKLPSVLRASRMFRSARIARSTSSPKLRIVRFLLWFLFLAHVFGCGFFFIGLQQPGGATYSWVIRKGLQGAPIVVQYIQSLFWAMETMCTVGFGDNPPATPYEQGYACFVLLATGVVYAAVFGNMANAIHSLTTSVRRHHDILDGVHEFSDIYALPVPLHHKLLAYAQQHWNHTKGFEVAEVIGPLPLSVKAEILSHINSSLLQRVPLFRECSPRFLDAIILQLRPVVCLPGDYIFREGDMSRDMYFIRHGRVQVVMDDPTATGEQEVVVAEIGGQSSHPFFGEIALLLGDTRTASVRALEPTMLSMIRMADFYDVMSTFALEEDTLREVAMSRLRGDIVRMAQKDRAEALRDQRKEKATELAMAALAFMKGRAKKRLEQLVVEQRRRLWKRQRSDMGKQLVLTGALRFKRAVFIVMDRLAEGRRLGSPKLVSPGVSRATSPVARESQGREASAVPKLTLSLVDSNALSQRASVTSPVAGSTTPHILAPPSAIPLHRHAAAVHPQGSGEATNARLRSYRSHGSGQTASPSHLSRQSSFSASRPSTLMDRSAMTALLRSSTLRELKSLVQSKDSASLTDSDDCLQHAGHMVRTSSSPASEAATPISSASPSDSGRKGSLLFLLNHQGSMRDVLAMKALSLTPALRGSTRGSVVGSKEPSRPVTPTGGEGSGRGMGGLGRTMTGVGRGEGESVAAVRGAMIDKLGLTRGKTIVSPSGSTYRAAGQRTAGSAAPEGSPHTAAARSSSTFSFAAPLAGMLSLHATASPTSTASSALSPTHALSPTSALSPSHTLSPEGTSPAHRSARRRTLGQAQEMAAHLQSLQLTQPRPAQAAASTLQSPAALAADSELAELRRARDDRMGELNKRRSMRQGDLAGLTSAVADGAGNTVEAATVRGAEEAAEAGDRRRTFPRGFTLRAGAVVQAAVAEGSADAAAAVAPAAAHGTPRSGGRAMASGDTLLLGSPRRGPPRRL